jgi:capsular exopolysaccharide synthesis family protein
MKPIREALDRSRSETSLKHGHGAANSVGGTRDGQHLQSFGARLIPVSTDTLRDSRIVAGEPMGPDAGSYKMLRTQILRRMAAKGLHSVAITSPHQGQGKSLTAANLAVSMAREADKTVLLIDLDLRRPSIHGMFGVEPEFGLSDYLAGDIPVSQFLFSPGIENLVVVPAGKPTAFSSEMLLSDKAVALAEALRSQYESRIEIFDLPPLLATDDVIAFLPNVDSVLLVVEERKTRRQDVTRSMELLKDTELLGTVLNNSVQSIDSYYY